MANGAQAWTLTTLYSFCAQDKCADGEFPVAGLVQDSAGNLYGTTETGGGGDCNQGFGCGAVFELSPNGKKWSYRVLHSFCYACGDGVFPAAGLILDTSGNLYGATEAAGPDNERGIVFRLSPNANRSKWKEKILHVFTGTPDGDGPITRLAYQGQETGALYDGSSPLYGATATGGAANRGGVYELYHGGYGGLHEHVIYSFCESGSTCADGWEPSGDLLFDAAGHLYGETFFGGSGGGGTVFALSPGGKKNWTESLLYSFCSAANCSDGDTPQGQLAMDAHGRLFGTTEADSGEGGTVFKLAQKHGAWQEAVLHPFCTVGNCADGYLPVAGVIIDPLGNLFGTNELGGTGGEGTVFKLSGGNLSTIYDFCSLQGCADGSVPGAPLIMDSSGNLYGTTSQGGAVANAGTVFELSSRKRDT